jgi:hypothetical protein
VFATTLLVNCTALRAEAPRENLAEPGDALLIPIETSLPNKYQAHSALEGKDSNGNRTLFQQTSALFSSSGELMGRCLVAILDGSHPMRAWGSIKEVEATDRFSFEQTENGRLDILEDGNLVLSYRFGIQSKPGVPADRFRSTYIHPLVDPFGSVLTDDFPEDHLHHRGLSWMWPNVTIGEKTHDLWHIRGLYQKFDGWILKESGPICGTIGVKNTWDTAERTVADEWVWVRTFLKGRLGRAVDISLTWKARERITIRGAEQRGYGGLCFRLGPRLETVITTPEGVVDEDSDLLFFPWADQSGRFGGSTHFSGVAVFQHPKNPFFPAGWCLRHYGFLGVSWPGMDGFVLEPGVPLTLRFRIWIHEGDARAGQVREAYQGFANLARFSHRVVYGPPR